MSKITELVNEFNGILRHLFEHKHITKAALAHKAKASDGESTNTIPDVKESDIKVIDPFQDFQGWINSFLRDLGNLVNLSFDGLDAKADEVATDLDKQLKEVKGTLDKAYSDYLKHLKEHEDEPGIDVLRQLYGSKYGGKDD